MADIFGYFDAACQVKPAHDPGLTAPCPFCTGPVGDTGIKTISLMKPGDGRSYFYRAHKACFDEADDEEVQHVESLLIDDRLSN